MDDYLLGDCFDNTACEFTSRHSTPVYDFSSEPTSLDNSFVNPWWDISASAQLPNQTVNFAHGCNNNSSFHFDSLHTSYASCSWPISSVSSSDFYNCESSTSGKVENSNSHLSADTQSTLMNCQYNRPVVAHSVDGVCVDKPKNDTSNSTQNPCTHKSTSKRRKSRPKNGNNRSKNEMSTIPHQFENVERSKVIFIWKLEDSLCIYQSLLNGSYARLHSKDVRRCEFVALCMNELIYDIADRHFFLSELQECNQFNIGDVVSDVLNRDNGDWLCDVNAELCLRRPSPAVVSQPTEKASSVDNTIDFVPSRKRIRPFQHIRQMYDSHRYDASGLLPTDIQQKKWLSLKSEINALVDNWHSIARATIALANSRNDCINILVSQSHLVTTLVQLLMYDLSDSFNIDDVYSCAGSDELEVFERIHTTHGSRHTFVVIGNADREKMAGARIKWPVWTTQNHSDLASLYRALSLGYM